MAVLDLASFGLMGEICSDGEMPYQQHATDDMAFYWCILAGLAALLNLSLTCFSQRPKAKGFSACVFEWTLCSMGFSSMLDACASLDLTMSAGGVTEFWWVACCSPGLHTCGPFQG